MVQLSTESLRSVLLLRGRQTGKDNVSSSLSPLFSLTVARGWPCLAKRGRGRGMPRQRSSESGNPRRTKVCKSPFRFVFLFTSFSRREIELGSAFLESICLKQSDLSARSDSCPSYVSTVSLFRTANAAAATASTALDGGNSPIPPPPYSPGEGAAPPVFLVCTAE